MRLCNLDTISSTFFAFFYMQIDKNKNCNKATLMNVVESSNKQNEENGEERILVHLSQICIKNALKKKESMRRSRTSLFLSFDAVICECICLHCTFSFSSFSYSILAKVIKCFVFDFFFFTMLHLCRAIKFNLRFIYAVSCICICPFWRIPTFFFFIFFNR